MSPIIFNGIIDSILKKAEYLLIKSVQKINQSNTIEVIKMLISLLAFADDILIESTKLCELKRTI